jgi:predicted RNase H-like HicB family nuclease
MSEDVTFIRGNDRIDRLAERPDLAGHVARVRRDMENAGNTYRVVVTHEDGRWLAEVPALAGAHTYARSLPALGQAVREVIVLAADLPDEAMPGLVLDFEVVEGRATG